MYNLLGISIESLKTRELVEEKLTDSSSIINIFKH